MPIGVFQIAALALAGAGTASAVAGGVQQRKASKIQRGVQEQQNRKDMLRQIRERKIAAPQVMQAAATQGTQGSSSAQGGLAAIGSGTAANLGSINMANTAQNDMYSRMQSASRLGDLSSAFTSFANLAAIGSIGGGSSRNPSVGAKASSVGGGSTQVMPNGMTAYTAPSGGNMSPVQTYQMPTTKFGG